MRRILIVDDDDELRLLCRKVILKNFNDVSVVIGLSAEDGWREFLESRPILVITDLRMETPAAGLRLAKKIKEVSKNIPVIMITGEEIIGSEEAVECVLPKPLDIEVLVKTIKKFLRKEAEK